MGWPVAASQSRAVPFVTTAGERVVLPSGLNGHGQDQTLMRSGRPDRPPVVASQRLAVPPWLPVRIGLPSGLNATA